MRNMRAFFRYLKNEIYNIFHSKSFLIVLSILSVIVIIDSILAYFEYKNNLTITINNIAISDGVYESYPFLQLYTVYNSWIGGRINTILTTVFFNTLPFFVVIPYGWFFLSEQKRGYDRIMACKLGKHKYFFGKYSSCFISGFITATIPLLISLGITFATIPVYKPDVNLALYYQVDHNKLLGDLYYLHPLCTVFLNVLMNGLFAGAWTTVPLALSFFVKNKYIVLFAPYLVLIYLIALFEKASAFRLYIGTSIINYIWLTSPDNTQSWAFYLSVMLFLILVPLGIVIERGKRADVY